MKTVSVRVPVESVRLASEAVPGGRIAPRIYTYTGSDALPEELESTLYTSKQATNASERDVDDITIPIYFIRSVEEFDPSSVVVTFSLGHHGFDEDQQPEMIEAYPNLLFKIVLSKAVVATLRALYRLDDDAAIRILSGSQEVDESDTGYDIDIGRRTLFSLAFPPEHMENVWEVVTEGMLDVSFGPYAVVGDDHHTGAPSSFRTGQRLMYLAMVRLLDGEVVDGVDRVDFIARAYERSTSISTEVRGVQNDIDRALRLLIRRAYFSTSPMTTEGDGGAFATPANNSVDVEAADEFAQLMSFNNMGEALVAVDVMSPYYRPLPLSEDPYLILDPLINGIPAKMVGVAEHLAKHEPSVLELCRWDFARDDIIERAEREYGSVQVAKAMLFVASFRAARYIEQGAPDGSVIWRPLVLTRSLGTVGDPYPWEIAAFNDDLLIYNTTGFEELISCPFSSDDHADKSNTVYLLTAMSQMVTSLHNDGWTLDLIDSRLRSSIHIPDLPKVRSLLACLLDTTGCDPDEDPVLYVIKATYDTYDIAFIAHAIALAIPLLADYAAFESGASVGSPRWNAIRERYIRKMMKHLSGRMRRVHSDDSLEDDDDDDEDDDN